MRKTALTVLLLVFAMSMFAFAASAEEEAAETPAVTAEAEAPAEEAEAPAEEARVEAETDFDFLKFAVERVLADFHPTANAEKAEANFDEKPYDKGDGITRARVGIYYSGWIQKHSMLADIDYRTDGKVRVTVIKDSNGLNLRGARFFKDGEWVSLAAVGWK